MNPDAWYFQERGIRGETLDACGVERNDTAARWKIGGVYKVRQGFNGGERKFFFDGTPPRSLFITPGTTAPIDIICEGESDAMRLWQEAREYDWKVNIYALSGVQLFDKTTFANLTGRDVYFIFDNDEADYAHKAVNDAWQRVRKLVPGCSRVYLPTGYKDVCEYLNVYNVNDLADLLVESNKPRFQFEALDLERQAEPPKWLWDTKMARGDIVMFQSEPNMGKSFLSMGLTVTMVNGGGLFLGHGVVPGKVLYVDEENPEDVIRNRLTRLGLTKAGLPNLRILHEQGIRLDRDPEKMYAEAEAFAPDLIVLDSLTRLHNEDENNAGAVSRLFNEAVHPLARGLGATVLIIHHTNKTQSGNSFTRTRGSSDINGVIDAGYDVFEHEFRGGSQKVLMDYKNRRGQRGNKIYFTIQDADGITSIKRLMEQSEVL